ncbi:hypothetical protein MSAN_01199200 [Mycena sanguinolenta]|uniref:Uncharacterized protein n=1 Tax=Mycena sanguinolenta TaxID=230812 RepID=A0A8H6YH45_9AGAR|nr:hypothetical protein MSAN_01199200 [Mycena sanguinolenta]
MPTEVTTGYKGTHGNDSNSHLGIGGNGGIGRGVKIPEPLLSIPAGTQVQGLNMTIDQFCAQHSLGSQIASLLLQVGDPSPSSLPYIEDLDLLQFGFRLGHIAELKWALRRSVGTVGDSPEQSRKPDLYGGIGGKGGYGSEQPGQGGVGESSVVPRTYRHRFAGIFGGISGRPRRGRTLFGGKGGSGGDGLHRGGEGGVGEASRVSIGVVSRFANIFGGIGGTGGAGGRFGGNGPSALRQCDSPTIEWTRTSATCFSHKDS